MSHALGKYDDGYTGGNDLDHAFSFPSEWDKCQRTRHLSHYLDNAVHWLNVIPTSSQLMAVMTAHNGHKCELVGFRCSAVR
ncbi:hypothetical protein NicSoilB8_29010 [Arthrobacter sp. NicSoilB8]|nr:hypothetical protein NicSoilB8_29010 [Arthrobacter sp. NicSoilB8]